MKEESEGRPMGQVIKIEEARIRDHLGEMVRVVRLRRGSTRCSMPRRTSCAGLCATSEALIGSYPGR